MAIPKSFSLSASSSFEIQVNKLKTQLDAPHHYSEKSAFITLKLFQNSNT